MSMMEDYRNRFMIGRQRPYEGWRDRMSRNYVTEHNRLVRS